MTIIGTPIDRLHQKHDLLVKLGLLFGPLKQLIDHPSSFDEVERTEIIARYSAEWPSLANEFEKFCKSKQGHSYEIEYIKFYNGLYGVITQLAQGISLKEVLPKQIEIASCAIDEIPTQKSEIIKDGSPFTAYCRLLELCKSEARKKLIWIDPYFDASIFSRFLSNIRKDVEVILVTSEPRPSSRRDKDRWANFLDVSRLYAIERGPDRYRLIVNPDLHDRWIVFDDERIYALGGSAKDAATKDCFTIASVKAAKINLERIQSHIETGKECFGPSLHEHP
jgi:hypothetical protein